MKRALLAALLTAGLLNLAFAPFNQGYLAFLALVPLLSLHDASWKLRLVAGWLAGFLTQALGYFWIFYTIRDFGGQSEVLSLTGGILFWLYQGADLGLWLAIAPALFAGRSLWFRVLGFAGLWLVLQTAIFPYVFPWNYGAAFTSVPVLDRAAALWSAHGLAFWMVVAQAVYVFGRPVWSLKKLSLTLFVVLGVALVGALPRYLDNSPTDTWRVGVVQPNLIPWAKQSYMSGEEMFRAHLEPSLEFEGQRLDLLVWPETALSINLHPDSSYRRQIQALSFRLGAALVTGAVGIDEDRNYYNEIWMFTPDHQPPQVYQKERLVMFSEQLPWVFSWARYFDDAIGGFSQGRHNRSFRYRDREFVPLVCFEALFPAYVRSRPGHAILNLTNDAWFGQTKASWQHLQQIRQRTVEMGVPLIRATNSGVSCWIDRDGRIHQPSGIYSRETLLYEVAIAREKTRLWSSWGEMLLHLAALGTLLAGLGYRVNGWVKRRRG